MMNVISNGRDGDAVPLSLTRGIADFPIGNLPLREHHRQLRLPPDARVDPQAWLDPDDVIAFLSGGMSRMVDAEGSVLLSIDSGSDRYHPVQRSFRIRYAWDLIRANELHVGQLSESQVEGEVHAAAVIEGVIRLGVGSRILPGVFIEGNVVIGNHCKIGPNCYLRGNTSIGDSCHIGQSVEIKNSVIFNRTNVGHLSYVGDSVLGEGVNLGAGTIISNLRHDGMNHRSMIDGGLIDTGRRKFGAILGDGVHTGIHTSIYPGRKLWPHTSTLPGEVVARDLMGNSPD